MTERNFGRRNTDAEPTKIEIFRTEFAEPLAATARKQGLTPGRIVLAIVGILVSYNILVHSSQKNAASPAPSAAAVSQGSKTTSARKCGATLREYEALQTGVSLGQAMEVIGCKGQEMSRVSYGGQETIMVSWPGEAGVFSSMNATFDNDRLVAKGQLGLE